MVNTIRRAAWRDGADDGWHDDLIWYAAGVHQMKALTPRLDDFLDIFAQADAQPQLPPDLVDQMASIAAQWGDPMSFGYQSQVHGTFLAKQSWPRNNGRQALWQECAHNHWFFLPWHRAFLLEFEAVVREHIRGLDGPADDWALPYWNYTDWRADPSRVGLPLALRGATLPDGVEVPGVEADADGNRPNPLFNPTRVGPDVPPPGSNVAWASATLALLRPHYANQEDRGFVSFGGGVLETPNNAALFHDQARELGQLDAQPHGSVHVHIGGTMGLFQTAGLDPVFWMHHCNIDRLWETYAHDLGHGYPFQDGSGSNTAAHTTWVGQKFRFLQSDGTLRTWTAPDVLDVGKLGYGYDTTAPPPLPVAPEVPGSDIGPFGIAAADDEPEPVAQAAERVALTGEQDVVLSAGPDADRSLGVGSFPGARWLLRFEGIRSSRPVATSYEVFLGLQPGEAADPEDAAHYAGLLSLFGVFEASRDDGTSAGDGQRRRIDVTPQVGAQSATLRPAETTVRLTPVEPDRDLAGAGLSIERITLEFV